jgi:diguanylate cyclase (GGDEF)-like protein
VTGSGVRRLAGVHPRLRAYIAGAVAAGLLCVLWAAVALAQSPPPHWGPAALAIGLMIVSRLISHRVRVRGTAVQFDWAEAAVLIAVVLTDGPVVVLGAVLAVGLVLTWRGLDPVKVAFNAATTAVASSVAVWVAYAVAGGVPDPTSVAGAGALLLGILAFPVVNDLAVAFALAEEQGVSPLRPFRDGVGTLAVTFVGNVTAAFGVLALGHADPLLLLLAVPPLWLVHQAYAGRLRARSERVAWQRLAATVGGLNRLDETEVIAAAVRGAAGLFSADVVEIELLDGPESRRLTRGSAHGEIWHGAPGGEARAEPTVLSTPLVDSGGVAIGEVRLCFRSEVVRGEREGLAMATFAGALVSALRNAQVHHRLSTVATRKEHEATHDALTGLPNRNCLLERGEHVRAKGADGTALGLLLLDFNHFKEVNDTLGHAAGDLLLTSTAVRLGDALRDGEMLARLGGDEFALLLPRLPGVPSGAGIAEARARELLAVLGEPVVVGGVAITVEAGVGVALTPVAPGEGCDTAELLRRAEVAMYEAKRSGRAVAGYEVSRDAGSLDRLALAAELRAALDRPDQLVLHLQPSIDLASGAPIGAEALIRWEHPRRGSMAPAEFVPMVEHTDLVRPFSRYVLDRALEVSSSWRAEGLRLPIAVNLSARSLLDRDLPDDVAALLAKYHVPPELLVLEITETVVMSELEVVEEVLDGLRALGVQLSVDDFGTGYSSLTFLARIRVDEVKIDRSFVQAMNSSREAAAIVRTTIELARSLGLRVVAEGVERADQRAALTRLGCDAAQGYHLFPPMPVDQATAAIWTALAGIEDHGPAVVRLGRGRRTEDR